LHFDAEVPEEEEVAVGTRSKKTCRNIPLIDDGARSVETLAKS
jgi:hypothetical protein